MPIFVSGAYIIYWCAYLVGYYIKHANGTARYCISQSFDLPPATTPVSHLTCPQPLHHCTTMSPRYCITTSLHYCITTLPHHCVTASPHYHITMSPCEIFPTTLVWIIWLALPLHYHVTIWDFPHHIGLNDLACPYHCITMPLPHCVTASPCYCITMSPHHCITASPCHCVTMLPCHHLTILLHYHITVLPHHCVTALLHYHVSQSFDPQLECKKVKFFPHHLFEKVTWSQNRWISWL